MPIVHALCYARRYRSQRWRRAIAALFLAIVLLGVAFCAYGAYQSVTRRMSRLQGNLCLQPLDWSTVLRSPDLCRLAWELSSDNGVKWWQFASAPDAVRGLRLLGTEPESTELDIAFPLRYASGRLHLTLVITNRGDNSLLIPALQRVSSRDTGSDGDSLGVCCVFTVAWLAPGAQVVRPGETATLHISVAAPPRPRPTSVLVFTPAGDAEHRQQIVFVLSIGRSRYSFLGCEQWEDTSRGLLRTRVEPWEW